MVPLCPAASAIRQPSKLKAVVDVLRNSIHSLLGKPIYSVGSAINSAIIISYRLASWDFHLPLNTVLTKKLQITYFIAGQNQNSV